MKNPVLVPSALLDRIVLALEDGTKEAERQLRLLKQYVHRNEPGLRPYKFRAQQNADLVKAIRRRQAHAPHVRGPR